MNDSEDGAAQRNRSRAREAALKKMKDRKERDRRGGESEDEVPSTSDKRKELQRKRMQSKLLFITIYSLIYLFTYRVL